MLSESNESANKARDSLCVTNAKLEELRTRCGRLESSLEESSDTILKLRREVLLLVKQRNIFCNTARRLYAHITRIYHSCSISESQHKRLLPFASMPVNDVNQVNFDCESIVSMEEIPSSAYSLGVIDCKELDTEELIKIVNTTLSKSEQKKIIDESDSQSPSKCQVNLDNVTDVKKLNDVKIKEFSENQPFYKTESDDEILVDCSGEIFPPKDPRCSTSGTKPGEEHADHVPKKTNPDVKKDKTSVPDPEY